MGTVTYRPATDALLRQRGRRGVRLSDRSRKVFITGSSGSGKTLLMGRHIVWGDLIGGTPLVVIDPLGPLIDTLLAKISRQPESIQRQLWPRIIYVDWSGRSGFVHSIPLYYRMSETDTFAEIAMRPLDLFLKLDPNLQTASIQGWNALKHSGKYMGMMCSALGLQACEGLEMLSKPQDWIERFRAAAEQLTELEPALAFFEQLTETRKPRERRAETFSLITKVTEFTDDPRLRAMYCADMPHNDLGELVENGYALLLDFRNVTSPERRRFAMMFVFNFIMEFIKARGAGRHRPLSIFIDEIAALFPLGGMAGDQFALDIDALINQYVRNYSLWLTVSSQALYQFPERLQSTLLSMPVQIHGVASDPDDAALLARRFLRYDPYRIKKTIPQYMSGFMGFPFVVQKLTEEFSADEQLILAAQRFMELDPFTFFARIPRREGSLRAPLIKMSIAELDRDLYPDPGLVEKARECLMRRTGLPIDDVLSRIAQRQSTLFPPVVVSAPKIEDAERYFWAG